MNEDLMDAFLHAQDDWEASVRRLIPVTIQTIIGRIRDVLPTAHTVTTFGEFTEDWLRVLRIRQVVDEDGVVLFDVAVSHDDRAVEDAIDEVNTEYLDLLLDLTGDDYMGPGRIDVG